MLAHRATIIVPEKEVGHNPKKHIVPKNRNRVVWVWGGG